MTAVEPVVTLESGAAEFAISRNGVLAYVPGGNFVAAPRSLVWVNRHGQEEPIAAPPRAYLYPRLSPDGTLVALDIRDQEEDIWIWNLGWKALTRLTDAPGLDAGPILTPDGQRIIFASTRAGTFNVFREAADNTGSVERLTSSNAVQYPTSISADETRLIVREAVPTMFNDLSLLRLDGLSSRPGPLPASARGTDQRQRQTEPLMETKFNEENGEISPDGRWLAYQSNAFGQDQISVRPFPNVGGGHWHISHNGGTKPVWSRSGRELFYLDGRIALTMVSIRPTPTFSADSPTKLFDGRYYPGLAGRPYDVSPDGQRFLMIKDSPDGNETVLRSMVVVVNWREELKARVPTR